MAPRFRHLDDLRWQECRRQQHGDHTASVWEKWLEFSPAYLSLYARWDPGMIVQPHGHNSNHLVFVIDGDMTCGDVHCRAGTHIGPRHRLTSASLLTKVREWRMRQSSRSVASTGW